MNTLTPEEEQQAKAIEWELQKSLGTYIKSPADENTLEKVKSTIVQALSGLVPRNEITSCGTLWHTLTFGQKLRWFWYNKFTSRGQRTRDVIDTHNAVALLADENASIQEYPWYAQLYPKSIIVFKASLVLSKPMEYIEVDIKIDTPLKEEK